MKTRNTTDIINNLSLQEIRNVINYLTDDIYIMHQTSEGIEELEIKKVIISGRIIEIHTTKYLTE